MFASIIPRYPRTSNTLPYRVKFLPRRQLSLISTCTSFPTTLHRFQTQRSSGLSDYKRSGDVENGVLLSADGLVHSRVSIDVPFCNGAVFMGTFTMQQWVRTSFDDYNKRFEEGQSTSKALILSVGKGTSVPKRLTLLYDHSFRFSLQPSHPMSVQELNDLLSEFYYQNATLTDAEEWLDWYEDFGPPADEDD